MFTNTVLFLNTAYINTKITDDVILYTCTTQGTGTRSHLGVIPVLRTDFLF